MNRNSSLQVWGLVVLIITAGCAGGFGGLTGGTSSFSADPVHVADSTVSSTKFSVAADKEISFERSFDVGDQSKKVVMNAHMVQLQRSYEGTPLGSVVILSLPQVKVLGQQLNVVEQIGPNSLVKQAQGSTGELKQQQKIGEHSVTILGQQRSVKVYAGTATRDGESAKAKIYIVTFDHKGDTIVGVAIIPQVATDAEDAVLTLFEGIRYG